MASDSGAAGRLAGKTSGQLQRSSYAPRIYLLHPLLAGPVAAWPRHFERIAALGFDHLLLPPPFAPGREGSLWLTADFDRLHPALAFEGGAEQGLRRIAEAARSAGLSLLLDWVADRLAADAPLIGARPQDFEVPEAARADAALGEAADPRRGPLERGSARWRLEQEPVRAAALAFWKPRLMSWLDAGVRGLRCHAPQHWPRDFARSLIAAARVQHPQSRFLAVTTEMPWSEHARLEDQGFDASFSSTAWWDYRSAWLIEEIERLRRIAPSVVAAPEAPFGRRLAHGIARGDWCERAARRALRLAAAVGDGHLVPMGFEYGADRPLDPRRGRPQDFDAWQRDAPYDLSAELARANAELALRAGAAEVLPEEAPIETLRPLHAAAVAGRGTTALLRVPGGDPRRAEHAALILINTDLDAPATLAPAQLLGPAAGGLALLSEPTDDPAAASVARGLHQPLTLDCGELRVLQMHRARPVLAPAFTHARRVLDAAVRAPRASIERITPAVDGGLFAVKRIVGETVRVEADVFMDGHEQVAAALLWRPADESGFREVRMRSLGNDRYAAEFPLERLGRYCFTVEAWRDAWGSYRHEIEKKHAARLQIPLELQEGRQHIAGAVTRTQDEALRYELQELLKTFDAAKDDAARTAIVLAEATAELMARADTRPFAGRYEPVLQVDAEASDALFASWYELFPRSASGDESRHGRFHDVIGQLPRIRDMGFDVLYFPPIHPIGVKHRKGRNNSLTPAPDDPGSPYAIGSAAGGHDAIEPRLGTLEDFRRLRAAAAEHGLEIAIDFAIQCSPDHPWLKEHPQWFAWRPDGSLKYAENPPKKYEDIVNVDFYNESAAPELWAALRDVVLFWVGEGIRLFRVDNPHTKPLPFWKWMIADVRGRHPDVVFLSEAFTRPTMMRRLAKIGFSQSYTYFTWRNSKQELTEYLIELTQSEMREYYRPHFFVNTPDINPYFLQTSGRPGFLIRAALAATLSGLWGMYSGFELCEARALPGKEEYLDSEKYQLRAWDWDRPGNIAAEIALLNRIRRHNPALHSHLGLTFLDCHNGSILYYEKATPARDNVLLCWVNLDPRHAQEGGYELPLWRFGLPDDATLAVEDLVSGARFALAGKQQRMRLDPSMPFAIWRVNRP